MKYLIVVFMLFCSVAWGCELGTTYKDHDITGTYGGASETEIDVEKKTGDIFHVIEEGYESKLVEFDKHGMIVIPTDYSYDSYHLWLNKTPDVTREKPTYVVYRGHRWYPNYHGTIYVYQDGREVR